jgi:hypothetical protein
MGAKVKIWSLSRPTQPTLAVVLDHTDPTKQAQQQQEDSAGASAEGSAAEGAAAAAPDVNPAGKSNMRWLIKSELAGSGAPQGSNKKASTMPDIVAEAIAHAAEDVPEVMQVRSIVGEELANGMQPCLMFQWLLGMHCSVPLPVCHHGQQAIQA